jgi:hypothetical protein
VKLERTDFFLGLGAIVVSAGYLYVASGIEESMLSDATGAGGVPRVLGWVMAALGLLLCLRSVSFAAPEVTASSTEAATGDGAPTPWTRNPHVQALVLVGILAAYVVLAPYLGYMLATAVLLAAAAAYGGAPIDRNLLLIAAAGGIALWLSFAWALNIPMQTSVLLDWF